MKLKNIILFFAFALLLAQQSVFAQCPDPRNVHCADTLGNGTPTDSTAYYVLVYNPNASTRQLKTLKVTMQYLYEQLGYSDGSITVDVNDINAQGVPDATTYLRGDGAWVVISGSGDMMKTTYDTDDDGVVDNSEQLGGFNANTYLRNVNPLFLESTTYPELNFKRDANGEDTIALFSFNSIRVTDDELINYANIWADLQVDDDADPEGAIYFSGQGSSGTVINWLKVDQNGINLPTETASRIMATNASKNVTTPYTFQDDDAFASASATGIASSESVKAYVDASSGGGVTFGADNQIPYTNSSTDDYDYSTSFIYDGTTLSVAGTSNSLEWNGSSDALSVGGLSGTVVFSNRVASSGSIELEGGIDAIVEADDDIHFRFNDDGGSSDVLFKSNNVSVATIDYLGDWDYADSNQLNIDSLDTDKLTIAGDPISATDYLTVALSATTGDLAAATNVESISFSYAITITDVRIYCDTAPTGSAITVDVNEDATTILSTKSTIDATEKDSNTAATASVISDASIAAFAVLSFDIDAVGSTIAGSRLKIELEYKRQ